MAIIVQKYGGSSISDIEKIKFVAKKVVERKRQGNKIVVVVSAMGKTTDNLISLAKQISSFPPERELDLLLSTGEIVSVALLCMAIENYGEQAEGFPGYFAGIKTDALHTKARIQKIEPSKIIEEIEKDKIVVVAGFQGISSENAITTLGRGGSDLTAIAIAGAIKADICEIYTDVEGIFTSDPNRIKKAKLIPFISYEELLEMASSGAKVMQSRAVEFAKKYKIPFIVKSTFKDGEGTMVKEIELKEGAVVSSVAIDENQAKISIFRVPDRPGIAGKIFSALGQAGINVDMIVQNVGRDGFADLSFTVNINEIEKTKNIVEKIAKEIEAEKIITDPDICKISIIGIGMMNQPGVAGRMFSCLGKNGINIEMISTSEIKISCVVRKKDGEKALIELHKEFIENK
ncbi:MAG: aspartate kinase [Candidatus Omnitrophica bacterium]|nr:aspartate kinase [Candidatus Omnitrophota bacterium]MCM8802634.1 aspartate kinase [Candidatus Omnitrophota bacterium]